MDEKVRKLGSDMLTYASSVDELNTPEQVLDGLNRVSTENCRISVLGAMLLPLRWGHWGGVKLGKTAFLHSSVPKGWYEEWWELTQRHPALGLSLARSSMAPFTSTETMRRFQPLGIDRWPFELALKYGIRDGLTCPVGGRWVVAFWSTDVLSSRLTDRTRAILFMGATFCAIRLQAITSASVERIGGRTALTPREVSALRLLSLGHRTSAIASRMNITEETVRSHLKKAQTKLGARTRTQAVAQAIRLQLMG